MDFIKAISNGQDILTDQEFNELIESLDLEELDEDALERVTKLVTQREIALYSYLVGKQNALKAKIFVDKVQDGKTVPTNIAKGYLPAVDMIHDIVKAGPSYINLLKSLHQRAKKASK
jgi:hypothetical protein